MRKPTKAMRVWIANWCSQSRYYVETGGYYCWLLYQDDDDSVCECDPNVGRPDCPALAEMPEAEEKRGKK